MKLATLGAEGWWFEGERTSRPAAFPKPLEHLLTSMRELDAGVLYVHASALEHLGLPLELEPPAPGERRPRHPWLEGVSFEGQRVSRSALSPSIECGELEVLIGAYQDGAGDPFAGAADARELLAAVVAFRDAFPRPWAFRNSAIQTGWKLMHAPWARGARKARAQALGDDSQPVLEGVAPGQQVEIPYGGRWAATGGASFPQLPWVMAWDVNGQRLAATARLSLGIGGLEQRDGADFDPKLPGYHLVSSIEHPYPGQIPAIFEPGWHTTPRVAMAAYLGIGFELARSHVWTEHVPYLNPWYEAMRDARAKLLAGGAVEADDGSAAPLLPSRALGLQALKQSYLQPLGRLRSGRAREQGSPHYRPDWYDHVIGQELAREYLRLHQLAQLEVPVLAVYFDTIVIESESCDPIAGAPPPLEVSVQLGKYKPVGQLPTQDAHKALYRGAEGYDVGALVKALKAAGTATGATAAAGHPPAAPAALSAFTRPTHGGYPA